MKYHIKVVAQLSKVLRWNKYDQQIEPMYIVREEYMSILGYVDFEKICHVIKYFTQPHRHLSNQC